MSDKGIMSAHKVSSTEAAVASTAALAAAVGARSIAKKGWRRIFNEAPPSNPKEPVSMSKLLLWVAVTGMVVTGGRVFAQRYVGKAFDRRNR